MKPKLNINIRSFSYKKGIPTDDNGNGGGFVFDCRGILNPGRIEEFKTQTGRDMAVQEYLENQTEMPAFLNAALQMIDISVQDFLNRNFTNLEINYGCTGGQHRSVYAADKTAEHLKFKFPEVELNVKHVVQEEKNWINEPY
ncbi:MAG: RNase adapter RapZ [Flavobacteriaceae bacterium]|nr:RNase adapter RapZ [Flavobacteriaceae bacterium]